jgi:hypothetical protein
VGYPLKINIALMALIMMTLNGTNISLSVSGEIVYQPLNTFSLWSTVIVDWKCAQISTDIL